MWYKNNFFRTHVIPGYPSRVILPIVVEDSICFELSHTICGQRTFERTAKLPANGSILSSIEELEASR